MHRYINVQTYGHLTFLLKKQLIKILSYVLLLLVLLLSCPSSLRNTAVYSKHNGVV